MEERMDMGAYEDIWGHGQKSCVAHVKRAVTLRLQFLGQLLALLHRPLLYACVSNDSSDTTLLRMLVVAG